jgi:hypothetical protein
LLLCHWSCHVPGSCHNSLIAENGGLYEKLQAMTLQMGLQSLTVHCLKSDVLFL